jgi:exonuclease III
MSNILEHKPNIICLQETHSCNNIEEIWRRDNTEYSFYFTHGLTNSKGALIMLKKDLNLTLIKTVMDKCGRYIIMDVKGDDSLTYTLINCYMPTKNYEKEQIKILTEIYQHLLDFQHDNVIWCGDLNINIEVNKNKPENNNYRNELKSIMGNLYLSDVWKTLNPNRKGYTWNRGKNSSRLDYFIISDHLLNKNIKCEIHPTTHTDHLMLTLDLETQEHTKTGPGQWKFNASLLSDTKYVELIKNTINKTVSKFGHLTDKGQLWEIIKHNIKRTSISYSITKKKNSNCFYKKLKNDYGILIKKFVNASEEDFDSLLEQKEILKLEIESIEREKSMGVILRSRCRYVEEGEKNTAYFCAVGET